VLLVLKHIVFEICGMWFSLSFCEMQCSENIIACPSLAGESEGSLARKIQKFERQKYEKTKDKSKKKKIGGRSYANKAIELIKVIINIFIIVPDIILYFILEKIYFPKTVFYFPKSERVETWSETDPPFLIPGTCQVSKTW